MGTVNQPNRRHVPKRERKFTLHDVPIAQEETRWQCATCTGVIASDADKYCLSCKLYWEDAAKGLFDDPGPRDYDSWDVNPYPEPE